MTRLANKVALITGGGAGIGAATARLFCAEGAAVTLVDSDMNALMRTSDAIRLEIPNAKVIYHTADVANTVQSDIAVQKTIDAFGELNILINNASMRNYTALANVTSDEWQAMIGVNLIGTSNYCRAALPELRKTEHASIVNVSSCYAVKGRKGMGLYDATKAGQLAITRTLAFEEACNGVRVNAICPGSTMTEFHVDRAHANGKSIDKLKTERKETSMLGRWASPSEIAWPILWLASSEGSFITGAALMVDGGLSAM